MQANLASSASLPAISHVVEGYFMHCICTFWGFTFSSPPSLHLSLEAWTLHAEGGLGLHGSSLPLTATSHLLNSSEV